MMKVCDPLKCKKHALHGNDRNIKWKGRWQEAHGRKYCSWLLQAIGILRNVRFESRYRFYVV